jgi:hypothetical protein
MFIALGVAPKIIMVVEDKYLLLLPVLLLVKVCSGQATEASTNHN